LLCLATGAAQVSAAGAAVVLNEVNCEGTDWVELVNTSDTEADISGWLLTDDPLTSTRADHRLLFPTPTVIPARSDLVVEKGLSGFPFGISCGNDTIRLADSTGTLADEIAVPTLTSAGDTWGRYPNGSGGWLQTTSTKGAPNEPSSAGGAPPGDLAAWMFDPGTVVVIDLTFRRSRAMLCPTTPASTRMRCSP
jgi:lamin tail-like protein